MKWYLAGPMSGIEESNYPAFRQACHTLRNRGLHIVSPHDFFPPVEASQTQWEQLLRYDLRALTDCHGIILLPGWSTSRGAILELSVALALDMEIYCYQDGALKDIS